MMKRKSIALYLIGFVTTFSVFGEVIQNTEFVDYYLYNCSRSDGIQICYPEREENPSEVISYAQEQNLDLNPTPICEDLHHGDVEAVALCISTMRNESDYAQCDIMYPDMGAMNDICKDFAKTVTSFSELVDQKLITCEADYQEYLREVFSEDFKGLNISFSSGVDEIDFIKNAEYPDGFFDYRGDILLLPEHKAGAFCNEDGKLSLTDVDRQVSEAKRLMEKIYLKDSVHSVNKILDDHEGELAIISVTCPLEEPKAELIGWHDRVGGQGKPLDEESKEEKLSDEEIIKRCMTREIIDLFEFDKMMASSSPIGPTIVTKAEMGQGLKKIPYTSMAGFGINKDKVINNCLKKNGIIEHRNDAPYIKGRKVPFEEYMAFHTNAETGKSLMREVAEEFAADLNDPSVDVNDVYEVLENHNAILAMNMAKKDSEKVARDGYYFSFCFETFEFIEVKEGNVIDRECFEMSVDEFVEELESRRAEEESVDWAPNYEDDDFVEGIY